MRKKSISLLAITGLLLLVLPKMVQAQNKDEKAVLAILNSQIVQWNKGNLEEFMKGYWNNDSLMFVGRNGPTFGYRQTLANYLKNYPDQAARGVLSFNIRKVQRLSAEYYFVLGKFMLKRTMGDASGYFTLLFRKFNQRWLIVCDHSS